MAPRERMSGRQGSCEYTLAAAELGVVAAQTVMVAVLPVLLAQHGASSIAIGFAIGGEGVFALLLPFFIGALSDRVPGELDARFGRRMIVAGPASAILAGAVVMAPFLPGYWPPAGAALVSFAALHAVLTPFWTLLVEDVPDERRGRVQGIRVMFRSIGLAYGLVAAGVLFSLWHPLPFVVAAAMVIVTVATTWVASRRSAPRPGGARSRRGPLREAWKTVVANRPALWLLVADAFWNASVDGIRPYFFIYARRTLGISVWQTSIGITSLVAGLGVASWIIGRLGDDHDPYRILEASSIVLAATFAVAFLARNIPFAFGVAAVAGAASAAVMTLPYPLFTSMVGNQVRGENTGIYEMSVTIGRIVSPLLVGVAVAVAARWMPRTGGYPAMWLVSAAFAAGGWWSVRRSRAATRLGAAAPSRRRATPCGREQATPRSRG